MLHLLHNSCRGLRRDLPGGTCLGPARLTTGAGDNQKYGFFPDGDGYRIRVKSSMMCVEAEGPANGNVFRQMHCDAGAPRQRFRASCHSLPGFVFHSHQDVSAAGSSISCGSIGTSSMASLVSACYDSAQCVGLSVYQDEGQPTAYCLKQASSPFTNQSATYMREGCLGTHVRSECSATWQLSTGQSGVCVLGDVEVVGEGAAPRHLRAQ